MRYQLPVIALGTLSENYLRLSGWLVVDGSKVIERQGDDYVALANFDFECIGRLGGITGHARVQSSAIRNHHHQSSEANYEPKDRASLAQVV